MSNLRDAKARGARKYQGPPCRVCGSEVKYTSSKSCVVCTTRRHMERKQREKEVRDESFREGIAATDLAND